MRERAAQVWRETDTEDRGDWKSWRMGARNKGIKKQKEKHNKKKLIKTGLTLKKSLPKYVYDRMQEVKINI